MKMLPPKAPRAMARLSGLLSTLRELPLFAVGVLVLLVLMALFAPLLAPHDPLQINLAARFSRPVFLGGSWSYPLGADEAGRCLLSRAIYGARLSLFVAAVALLIGGVVGTAVGLVAGYVGGRVDTVLMRLADMTISYPVILLALLLATAYGPRVSNLILAVSFVIWARFARVVRGSTQVIRELPFVMLARVAGTPAHRIITRHILPNVFGTTVVLASLQVGQVILMEASLSFLGAGVPPPEPAWGLMMSAGMEHLSRAWWVATVPAVFVMAAVLALNLFGDWLRDRFDPRMNP